MTAQDQLGRILHIIPRAASGGGASYGALAEELGVDRETVIDDLISVQSREYYHPTSTGAELQVAMEGDRVSVFSTGALQHLFVIKGAFVAFGTGSVVHHDAVVDDNDLRHCRQNGDRDRPTI